MPNWKASVTGSHARRAGVWAAAWAYLFVLACSSPTPSANPTSTARDSAGVRLVRLAYPNGAPEWSTSRVYSTDGLDSVRLGAGGALHARFATNGTLLIANGGEIVRLRADGQYDRRIAREGDGPGEFRVILHLGIGASGGIFASDFLSGRYTELTDSGKYVRAVNRLRPFGELEVEPIATLADGRILALPWQWRPNRGPIRGVPAGNFERDAVALLAYDGTGETTDTIGTWLGIERFRGLAVPFARSTHYSNHGVGTVIGVSDSLDVWLYEATKPRMHLVRAGPHHSPTAQDLLDWQGAVRRSMPGVGASLIQATKEMPSVPSIPGVGGLLLDDANNIWVGSYVIPGQRIRHWEVFSSVGVPIGRLDLPAFSDPYMPARTEVLDVAGERLALLREDDRGALVIEVRSIQRH